MNTFKSYKTADDLLQEVQHFTFTFVAERAVEIDKTDDFPGDLIPALASRRLLALEKLNDGHPLDEGERVTLMLKVIQILANVSPAVAKHVMDQNFGPVDMLRNYGSKNLSDEYIPQIQSGELQAAFLMTETHTGTNVRSFKTVATKAADGYLVNGEKDWITGAVKRQLHFIVVRSPSPLTEVGLLLADRAKAENEQGVVEFSDGKEKLGLRGLGEYRVSIRDLFVPYTHVILPCEKESLRKVMRFYNYKRLGQAAISLGLSQSALSVAYHYLSNRYPTEHRGLAFQNADFPFAKLFVLVNAVENQINWASNELVNGDDSGVPSSIAKYNATETAVKVTNAAAQLCGANGVSRNLPIERLMRDARMLTIAGGTSETMKTTIAKYLHPLLCGENFGAPKPWYLNCSKSNS